jgi:hypothetical protein
MSKDHNSKHKIGEYAREIILDGNNKCNEFLRAISINSVDNGYIVSFCYEDEEHTAVYSDWYGVKELLSALENNGSIK